MADALGRTTHEVYKITMRRLESDLFSRIKTTSEHDAEYVNLLNKLQRNEVNLSGT